MTKDNHPPSQYVGRDLEAMSFANNYHLWILKEFRAFIGNHLVEVGAGQGDFSQLLANTEPKSLVAIEPSSNLFQALEKNLKHLPNVRVFNKFFSEISLSQKPDTIFYINVLEHIQDDESELRYVYESLNTNGHVCIFVPALQWLYGNVDIAVGHFRRYHKKPLKHIMQAVGFEIVKCHYFDIAGILPWWLLFCVLKVNLNTNQVSVYDKIVVPVMQRIETVIRPPIGKNILVVGKK